MKVETKELQFPDDNIRVHLVNNSLTIDSAGGQSIMLPVDEIRWLIEGEGQAARQLNDIARILNSVDRKDEHYSKTLNKITQVICNG